ncbi:hypothetical protein NQ314_002709 [Rhamnusium bicolor]|uniref:NFACT RNA-binding domain-containing protein n=1 Tax=Rhamnusium bicolor TaxID=1586634 RepID=A0AAV8ZSA8_9CUCU|nr:hypothetical protein NQ314_002709 [Rhamnusium bicolor]
MKTRFNTYDIVCVVTELQKLIGLRVNNIYDIDNRTYLVRLQENEQKYVLLLESGNRIHTTNFEWPKNIAPSGFSMKMRKHLKNKRLISLRQLGTDRIIDLQFGSGEAAYHVILELYDRGNIVLTDHEFTILNILRPHTEGEKIKFAVREKYPQDRAREKEVGYIIQKKEERPVTDANTEKEFYSNQEFHPMIFQQHSSMPYKEFETLNEAVDEFFSSLESQKLELRAVQQERDAMKKLENVRKDHDQRLVALKKTQNVDKQKAELITRNQELVDKSILAIQTILANQVSWEDINDLVKDAASKGDPVAKNIKQLKLEINHISLYLTDPYAESPDSEESNNENDNDRIPPMVVDIDLALSAFANARKYMKPTDIYVHADIHGASSVVIKNPSGQLVPPKTVNEAGTMAICYSVAWEAKVVTNAYWVWGEQVSKTAPTGEYLTTGTKKESEIQDSSNIKEYKEDTHESDSDEEDIKFPDTHIKIQHFTGTKINILTEPSDNIEQSENEEHVIYLGDDKPVILKPIQTNSRSIGNIESKNKQQKNFHKEIKEDMKQQSKRGQKSKLKKIKEKYKDQDEEERKLRMEILQIVTITQREKDLLKAVKDDQLARNLPGKVKLSAPKLQTLRK